MIGPIIGGFLWDGWGKQAPFIFAAFIAFFTIPLVLFIKSKVGKKEEKIQIKPAPFEH
jgi:MFS family permease